MTNPTLGTQIASRYAELGKNVCGYDVRVWNFRFFDAGCAAVSALRAPAVQNVLAQVRAGLGRIGITLAKTDSGVTAQNQIDKFKSAAS